MEDVYKFLNDPRNSVIREKIVNYQFFYQVKLSGARRGHNINLSIPEIDKDGYDVVIDDGDNNRFVQIKTMMCNAKCSSWMIQKQLLRPEIDKLELLEFDKNKNHSCGYQGAVVLIKIDANDRTINNFQFYYCDIFTLKAFEYGLLKRKSPIRQKMILKVINSLQPDEEYNKYDGNTKVEIPLCAFVQVPDVDALLALSNLDSIKSDGSNWRMRFGWYLAKSKEERTNGDRKQISCLLKLLICDDQDLIMD